MINKDEARIACNAGGATRVELEIDPLATSGEITGEQIAALKAAAQESDETLQEKLDQLATGESMSKETE